MPRQTLRFVLVLGAGLALVATARAASAGLPAPVVITTVDAQGGRDTSIDIGKGGRPFIAYGARPGPKIARCRDLLCREAATGLLLATPSSPLGPDPSLTARPREERS